MADDEPPFDLFEPSADDSQPSWSTIPLPNIIHIELQTSVAAVWGSSLNLAAFLCSHAEMFTSEHVIELGAGAGLPALVAASLGASSVLGTDLDHHSVEYMLRAIEHNKLASRMTASRLDWADAAAIDATTPCPSFSLPTAIITHPPSRRCSTRLTSYYASRAYSYSPHASSATAWRIA